MAQEELGRLESCREAGTSGDEHHGSQAAPEGIAAAALVYFSKLGHLASCTADIRWALQKAFTSLPDATCVCAAEVSTLAFKACSC